MFFLLAELNTSMSVLRMIRILTDARFDLSQN